MYVTTYTLKLCPRPIHSLLGLTMIEKYVLLIKVLNIHDMYTCKQVNEGKLFMNPFTSIHRKLPPSKNHYP